MTSVMSPGGELNFGISLLRLVKMVERESEPSTDSALPVMVEELERLAQLVPLRCRVDRGTMSSA